MPQVASCKKHFVRLLKLGIVFVLPIIIPPNPVSMKKIIFTFLALGLCGVLRAQSFDDFILKRRYVDCRDVSFNAPQVIRSLRERNQTDSLYSFLDYWQAKCGNVEYMQAIRALLDIKTANFESASANEQLFNSMLSYKEINHPNPGPYSVNYEVEQYHKALKNEIYEVATAIQQTYSPDEALLRDFYAADSLTFDKIKQASPNESKLKKIYDKKLKEALRMPEIHVALSAGYYQPFGKLDVFGAHPAIGLIFGALQLRHNYDFVMDIRFGRSKEPYTFLYNGDLRTDNKWTSAYLGFEYTYDFIASKKFRAGLSPGIGYNGITAVRATGRYTNDAKILPALDLNAGLSFKYTLSKSGSYAGLQARYHWVDYRNPGGTELNGNYASVRLIFGGIFNYDRDYQLKRLDYGSAQ